MNGLQLEGLIVGSLSGVGTAAASVTALVMALRTRGRVQVIENSWVSHGADVRLKALEAPQGGSSSTTTNAGSGTTQALT